MPSDHESPQIIQPVLAAQPVQVPLSFQVHLSALTDFARELGTQLAGMTASAGPLDALAGGALPLGLFPEAQALSGGHADAVVDFRAVVGRAREAIDFAEDVTTTVAQSYRQADQQTAAELSRLGIDTGSV